MNEQELMKQINEQTKNLEIPDSISPENMKKMLDEQAVNWNTLEYMHTDEYRTKENDVTNNETTSSISPLTHTGKRNRFVRHLTAVACIALCVIGGITALSINNGFWDTAEATDTFMQSNEESATETLDDTDMESAEEIALDENESQNVDNENTLVTQSSLQSPSSYDAYYETLTAAFQEYYDSLATVTNEDGMFYEESEIESVGGETPTEAGAVMESVAEEKQAFTDSATINSAAGDATDDGIRDMETSLDSAEDTAASKDFSTTNTQEKTVDEGDIIKTDGTYIYKMISKFNNDTGYNDRTLTITETDDGNLKLLSTIDLSSLNKNSNDIFMEFHEFYLYKDYILVMYTKTDYSKDNNTTDTCITIYNIKDKEKPKQLKTLTQSGWYESSRISDGYLYTISNFHETNLDTKTPYTNYIPSINGRTVECKDIYYPRDIFMQTTYVVTSVNLSHPQDFTDTKAIPTNGGDVYVSDSSIYFYATLYRKVTQTEIIKLDYRKGKLTPGENAIIAGYLYGSFALSEYNDYLRIVATIPANNISLLREEVAINWVGEATAKSANDSLNGDSTTNDIATEDIVINEDVNVLYILDNNMKLTGKISGIAPGETIYSARFMGDIGYFVTFRNMDPLFSVDLSDPENPKILGQLKIPGFSNYLHPYGDGLLLDLGEEYDPNTMDYLGLKLSMFDISNPTDVTEQDKYIIENSAYSEVQYNHKALMIDADKNLFGFVYAGENETNYNYSYYFVTYTYDKHKGFIENARYEVNSSQDEPLENVRGIYIGDYLYLTTNKSITSYEIGSTDPISQVYFK